MKLTQNSTGVVLIAILAILGMGLTAATIDTTYSSDIMAGSGSGDAGGNGAGGGGASPGGDNTERVGEAGAGSQPLEIPEICWEILTGAPAILGLIIGFVGLVAIAYRQRGFIAAGFVGYLVGIPIVLGYGLVTQCGSGAATGGEEAGIPIISQLPAALDSAAGTTVPPIAFAGMFVVAAVVAIAVIASASGGKEIDAQEWEDDSEPGLEEFAAVAGEAADRIESTDASVDNAVYRAWLDMTSLLDIPNPDATTAGEFADAAIEAGLEDEDVSNMTTLFEEVRYGDMDPEPREELAVETLRSIEETYGVSDDDAGETGEREGSDE